MPASALSVTPFHAISGVVVLPSTTRPASRIRAITGLSTSHGWSAGMLVEPRSVGQPWVRKMSLIDAGTPSSAPIGFPSRQRASAAFACSSARSASTRQ